MEAIDESIAGKSFQQLVTLFDGIKQHLREKSAEKETMAKEVEIVNNKREWYELNVNQTDEVMAQYKQIIANQQTNINQLLSFKDECSKLQSVVLELNKEMSDREESHKQVVEQMRRDFDRKSESFRCQSTVRDDVESEMKLKIQELSEALDQKEKEWTESRTLYESKIKSLNESLNKYREISDKCEQNIRLNCLRQIEAIKEEYETQLMAIKQKCDQLGDTNAELKIELDSRNMSDNAKPASSVLSHLNGAPNSRPTETSDKIAIQILNFGKGVTAQRGNDSGVALKATKRKKLKPSNPLYLQYLRDEL